jgi:hypothetical protein
VALRWYRHSTIQTIDEGDGRELTRFRVVTGEINYFFSAEHMTVTVVSPKRVKNNRGDSDPDLESP